MDDRSTLLALDLLAYVVIPLDTALWWPFLLPIVLVVMFVGMFFLYVILPTNARGARHRRTFQNTSTYSSMPQADHGYEQGYQQQGSGENVENPSPFQSGSTWDYEQPQASYPDQV